MNRSALPAAAFTALLLLGGCASTDTRPADQQTADADEKSSVTGSHIPRKDRSAASVKSMNSQDAQDALRNTAPMIAPSTGGAK